MHHVVTGAGLLRVAACLAAMALLSACATPAFNYEAVRTEVSAPPVGSTNTVSVGDQMLEQGHYSEIDGIRLPKAVKVGALGNYTFSAGDYVKRGENAQGETYEPGNFAGSGVVTKGPITDPFQAMLLESNGTTLCGVTVFGVKVCRPNVQLTRIKVPNLTSDSFQQTLIYSGKVGNKINVGYREFSGSTARPAFNNDVEYDLGQSTIIGYKGSRLEILEATNDHITYRVVKNFNTPEH